MDMTREDGEAIAPDAFCIRPAEERDRAAIENIAQSAYAVYLERMDIKPFPMIDDYGVHIRNGNILVLEAAGRVEGYVVLLPRDKDTLLLDNIAVRPGSRGTGYGRALAGCAEEKARSLGCRRIQLYTNEVMTENLAWDPRLGYTESHRCVEKGYRRVYFVKTLL